MAAPQENEGVHRDAVDLGTCEGHTARLSVRGSPVLFEVEPQRRVYSSGIWATQECVCHDGM